MGWRPNDGKGIEIQEDVLVYKQTDQHGHTIYARCLGWVDDKVRGLRHAWVLHPQFGTEEMNPREGRLEGFTPVRVVLREKYDADMAAMEARIKELEEFVSAVRAKQAAASSAKKV